MMKTLKSRPDSMLQTATVKRPDGETRYYAFNAIIRLGGIEYDHNQSAFGLISRSLLPERLGHIDEPRVRMDPPGLKAADSSMLMLLFPEGGPVDFHLGEHHWRIHPHEYGLVNVDQPYRLETVPQPFVTHRMMVMLTPTYQDRVWEQVRGVKTASTPHFDDRKGERPPLLNDLVRLAFEACAGTPAHPWLTADAIVRQIFHWLLFHHLHNHPHAQGQPAVPPTTDTQILTALEFLRAHPGNRQAVQQAAKAAGMHFNTLTNRMQKALGMSPVEYLQRYRMERARALLRDTACSIQEVCDLVGYESLSHFRKAFQEFTGMAPLAFRQTHTPGSKKT